MKHLILVMIFSVASYAQCQDGIYDKRYKYWEGDIVPSAYYDISWNVEGGILIPSSICSKYTEGTSAYSGCQKAAKILFDGMCNAGDMIYCDSLKDKQ